MVHGDVQGKSPPARFNPLDAEFKRDPYRMYARFRHSDPVHWGSASGDGLPGSWYLFRYDDIARALKDPRFGREIWRVLPPDAMPPPPEEFLPLWDMLGRWMLLRDPPTHTRLRSLVNRAFTPRVVERLRPEIERIAGDLLNQAASRPQVDLIADFAFLLPVIVISQMLGVAPEDRAAFRSWSMALARVIDIDNPPDVLMAGLTAVQEVTAYLRAVAAERRKAPGDDLISVLLDVQRQEGEAGLTDDELLATCVLLLFAGHETTVNLIGNGTLALLSHPDQWAALRGDPSLVPNAVEELLRYDSPVQITGRFAMEDVEVGGRVVRQGDNVGMVLGSANRDPGRYADPDRLDVRRQVGVQASFGFGIHFCLGAPLARAEGQIALHALLQRAPNLALAGEPEWRDMVVLRGMSALPVTL